jgi:small subunit ribosomal protein S6
LNTYEVLIIFKPILDVENVDAVLNHFQKNVIEANQGEIVETDRIGRKRLAYEVKRFKDGFLTLYLLKLPPEKVADFKRACQLNDDVLRVTLVRQDEIAVSREPEGAPAGGMRREGGFRGGDREGGFRGGGGFRGDRGGREGGFRREHPPRGEGSGEAAGRQQRVAPAAPVAPTEE